jgi:hypothetical protein
LLGAVANRRPALLEHLSLMWMAEQPNLRRCLRIDGPLASSLGRRAGHGGSSIMLAVSIVVFGTW